MSRKHKKIIIILFVLLLVSVSALIGVRIHKNNLVKEPASVLVPDNIITPDEEVNEDKSAENTNVEKNNAEQTVESDDKPEQGTQTTVSTQDTEAKEKITLSLYKNNSADNTSFAVGNMFPGDVEIKEYCVKVSHKNTVTLKFTVDIHNGYEKLSEVLKMKVVLKDKNIVLYDGLMKDVPERLDYQMTGSGTATTQEISYVITAYLDTSVGNEYMNQDLKADFKWWVEETEDLTSPATGDLSNPMVWLGIMSVSLIALILLLKKKKEAVADGES